MAQFKIPSTSPVVGDSWVNGYAIVNVSTGLPIGYMIPAAPLMAQAEPLVDENLNSGDVNNGNV